MMKSTARRTAASIVFVACISFAFCPLGCGAAQEDYTVVNHQGFDLPSMPADPTMPEAIVEQLQICVRQGAADLRTYSHEVKFDITVADEGNVDEVKLRSSTLRNDAMESCMMQALASMSLPSGAFPLRSSKPISGGESDSYDHDSIGIVQVLGGAIAFGPLAIVAAGVTVAIFVTAEAVDELRKRRRIEKLCMPWLLQCLGDKRQPNWNIDYFGVEKDCQSCFEECKHEKGQWPDYKCPRPGYRPN